MNLITLDTKLREITEKEKNYTIGIKDDSWQETFPVVIVNNQKVIFFNFKEKIVLDGYTLITVRKHSRFQPYPLHMHDGVEINYMYSGSCKQTINGNTYELTKGQILLLDSETIHSIDSLEENDILINIFIDKDYLNSNFFNRFSSNSILTNFFLNSITKGVDHNNFIIFNSENSHRLPIFMGEFLCEWFDPSVCSEDIINNLFSLIISELINVYTNELTQNESSLKRNPIISILRYIEKHYKTCSLSSTASFFNLNANYLSNMLKKHTGYSYRELVQQQKIKTAKQLLVNSNMGISEISNYVGYENVTFFYKKFQEHCNCLPGEYRNKNS